MHEAESIQENVTQYILWESEIQTHHQIQAIRNNNNNKQKKKKELPV